MEMKPPALLVALVRALLPPADREHVLGDLQERLQIARNAATWSYLIDAMQTVPMVIWSRMRRIVTQPIFGLQALLVFAAFVAVLTPRLSADFLLLLKALFPTLIAMSVLLVADTYTTRGRRSGWSQLLIVVIALGVVWLAHVLAVRSGIPWSVPYRTVRQGLIFGFLVLSWVRFMSVFHEAHEHFDRTIPNTFGELRTHVEDFEREIRRRNRLAYAVCAVLMTSFGRVALLASSQIEMIGALITVAGTVFLAYQVSRFPAAAMPTQFDFATAVQFYRQELRRQSDFHSAGAVWLRLSLLFPGPILIGIILTRVARPDRIGAIIMQLAIFIALAVGTVALNQRMVRRYDRRLQALDQIHTHSDPSAPTD